MECSARTMKEGTLGIYRQDQNVLSVKMAIFLIQGLILVLWMIVT